MDFKKTGRNALAVGAQFRTGAGPMKDRREGSGGAVNKYRNYMEEADEDYCDVPDVFSNDCDD